ncbi:hypothetical protein G9P44_000897 [Scheffersomyces stipitis]|nr:hypothetical protein G9P44_000897 [Scheffersomyces stipitis]
MLQLGKEELLQVVEIVLNSKIINPTFMGSCAKRKLKTGGDDRRCWYWVICCRCTVLAAEVEFYEADRK